MVIVQGVLKTVVETELNARTRHWYCPGLSVNRNKLLPIVVSVTRLTTESNAGVTT